MRVDTIDYDAIIIGAGFSGIRSLWELNRLGLTVKCFEAGSDVGGAWYWNRYPGARTDSEAWVYLMNFAPELKDLWKYHERYPSQVEVQQYLSRVIDHFDLRQYVEFNSRIASAEYSESRNAWTVTTVTGISTTCRYFLPATGPLSMAKEPPFPGLRSFAGEWYQASNWPKDEIDFNGKRIAIVGTGATGVQIIPKIAPIAKHLTVFQRTPNYVLPGRNYQIDEFQAASIKKDYDRTWNSACIHPFGLAMKPSGKSLTDIADADEVRRYLDAGWESGGFHFQFESLDDVITSEESNSVASEYLRQKIRAIVKDPSTAETLCPKHPFMSKRPPCGHFYYEAYNRSNVELVDIQKQDIEIYEHGIRTSSGNQHEFDMIILAIGFDAGTGALSEMDVRGSGNKSLRQSWSAKLETFVGTLVPGFPNMFLVCGPHIPFGNMPVVLDIQVNWIGRTIQHMETQHLVKVEVSKEATDAWCSQLQEAFGSTLAAKSAKEAGAWFVGANIPGKANDVLFYFGGVPSWRSWLDNEKLASWTSLKFSSNIPNGNVGKYITD